MLNVDLCVFARWKNLEQQKRCVGRKSSYDNEIFFF